MDGVLRFSHLYDSSYLINVNMSLVRPFRSNPKKEKELFDAIYMGDFNGCHELILTKEHDDSDTSSI